ncbi:phosphoenolpyruvate carboxykinase [Clostridium perfringens]|uniref:Phosphoenolpyruvate carboxykinase n=1 Tax=Clostridium perfringens TaxID=1502 RepID=A0AAW9KDF7_CLOPF|nr:phosphoenolpyruvate carboxykinase [Clostridium perfringens]STB15621.1 putative P-loop kinase or ATPase distantly related to phosphoenolpyruvate carboxykinase [Clostridium novyi]ELC8372309.1 phosphoenolpyruvate carboxykinase [Clostridium perfringens]MBI5976186.1 phosphoenolpyruvate carboxykinase [Clostridium perfringens]MBI5978990.1 phosphoenolpyruvate carboxykinase [Clostridium perfringens]MBI5982431.1 phosphoenolpyruvate carboxykinase [Clostridium perfringens]
MRKEFCLKHGKVTMNFTAKYCDSFESIINSEGFRKVLETYLKKTKNKKSHNFRFLSEAIGTEDIKVISRYLISTLKLLSMMGADEVLVVNDAFEGLLEDKKSFANIIDDVYSFWRKLERYTVIQNNKVKDGIAAVGFVDANKSFNDLILRFYRRLQKNLLGSMPNILRQVSAGGNASIMVSNLIWPSPREYSILDHIPFIDAISLEAPFITYPSKNTRDGIFLETSENPLSGSHINSEEWFCYPAKVGELLAYVYFHRDFMSHGISLCNLFDLATVEECRGVKPDIIYVFGAKDDDDELKTCFYDDEKNNIMLGYANYSEEIDYFGYMKKMILTLHNIIMIKRGYMPIHGAMVNVVLKNGKEANIVIMGDSGAGKSESLEAFRALSEEYISDMTIIFDDMGVFKNADGIIKGYGTEIGAFVRLDDLDQGYAFKEIDRSIFMNPDKINARLLMPVCKYDDIIRGYDVDLFLYANNYDGVDEGEKSIEYFNNPEEAKKIFKAGARMAKGTTTENGLVESYFANPFGPVQKKEEMDLIIDKYFDDMFNNKVKVGQIKTCLGVLGFEKEGPKKAAIELFNIIEKM